MYAHVVFETNKKLLKELESQSSIHWIGFHTDLLRHQIESGIKDNMLDFEGIVSLRDLLAQFALLEETELERIRQMTETMPGE